jgi:outer membrane usher protein FimD/PapC
MWANCGLVFDGPAVTSWSDNIGVTAEDGLVLLIGFEAAGDVVVRPAPGAYEPCVLVYKIPNPMVLLPSPPA